VHASYAIKLNADARAVALFNQGISQDKKW
jgi:hypothetical protein